MQNIFATRRIRAAAAFLTLSPWLLHAPPACGDWGVFNGAIFYTINGGSLTYKVGADFNNSFLGNFHTASNSLIINGGELKTFKNGPSDVTGATFSYRIYAIDETPGSFIHLNLPFFSNDGGGNQTWQNVTANINTLSNTTARPGTYVIEFYTSATGTNPNETKFDSNSGQNYKATFGLNTPELTVNGVSANYTTTKLFVDETQNESFPLTIIFRPNAATNVTAVEIFSNLNRRDLATNTYTTNGFTAEEGIFPLPGDAIQAGDTNHYYIAIPMTTNVANQEYALTLYGRKTGAYRLTARYKIQGNTNWFWYTDTGMGRRDHAVVISPKIARDIVMYEVNTLNIKATGTLESQRSTFVDLWNGPGADTNRPPWNLDYVKNLGVNWLWFQPVHPYGVDGRHLSAADINIRAPGSGATTWFYNMGAPYEDTNFPYALGSPYAVKNFWEIEPRMSKTNTRAAAMIEFQDFVQASDSNGISIMLDAAFNHTAWDVELGALGVQYFATNSSPTTEIRNVEARFFSLQDNYDQRAASAGNIAPAPDRFDFGKWLDVKDVFFGRYAALVPNAANPGRYLNEEDWFDYRTNAPGYFDYITQRVWSYFGAYVPYWLEKTGHPPGTPVNESHKGIDGLRCDFGQGLPPQAWEYIINRARSIKWNFVFMAETLDGGAPPYRSNRHFDILNENILFAMKGTTSASGFRSIFEDRRNAFGQGLILLNTVSHDEDNYNDPWEALLRFALASTIDGAPMIFPGQELGISSFFGYDLMEKNFGKYIPHFKTYNSMMPLWNSTNFGNAQLYPVYSAISRARQNSPALRSSNRYFIDLTNGVPQQHIFSVAKYERAHGSPATTDVIFAFVNLDRNNNQGGVFNVNIMQGGSNLFGIKPARTYNVKNIAAYTAQDPNRSNEWLWGAGKTGAEVLNDGVFVLLNKVPTTDAAWSTAPFEAQYLKLYDVTIPQAPGTPVAPAAIPLASSNSYVLTNTVEFVWTAAHDSEGGIANYRLLAGTAPGASNVSSNKVGNVTNGTVTGAYGQTIYARVRAINTAGIEGTNSPSSIGVLLLHPMDDHDGDGMLNVEEAIAGTDPANSNSLFNVTSVATGSGATNRLITVGTQPLRKYTIYFADGSFSNSMPWTAFANPANGIGTWLETNVVASTFGFVDDEGPNTTLGPPASGQRSYRVNVEKP